MSLIHCTTIKGRPALVSSDGLNMTLNFLSGEPLGRSYALKMFGGMTCAPVRALLGNPQAVLTLEHWEGRVTWRVYTPKKTVAFTTDRGGMLEFFEAMDTFVPDFEAVIRCASLNQVQGFESLMTPATARLIADANLGDARIYGTRHPEGSAHCICFPLNPDVFIFSMSSESLDREDEYWSIP